MPKSFEEIKKDKILINYLEPIPNDSFIRHQLLKLFIDAGLDDFQSQILLSIILHGGQIKPKTLAEDINCNPSRLELPDGFPSLLALNLISISHTRPKTVILATKIDEVLERLTHRELIPNNFIYPKEALEILIKLDQYPLQINSNQSEEDSDFLVLIKYYDKLIELESKFPSLSSLLFFTLSSLWMNPSEAFILTKLITIGGKISKKDFFKNYLQNINSGDLYENSRLIKDDLQVLGFTDEELEHLIEKSETFYTNRNFNLKFSSEQQLNSTINCLDPFCLMTSMGDKEGKRKFKNLTLIKRLSQIADFKYKSVIDLKEKIRPELQILKLAYSNVKFVDGGIFLSSIADPSSSKKRLETDLKYAEYIYLVIIHQYFIEDIFLKIFDSENINCALSLIVAEEEKEFCINMLKKYIIGIQGKRGISAEDTITFIPSNDVPQDVLVGNTIILFYKVGSSMIIIHEEISKENPTEINTINNDVELAFKSFIEIQEKNREKTSKIISLINKRGV